MVLTLPIFLFIYSAIVGAFSQNKIFFVTTPCNLKYVVETLVYFKIKFIDNALGACSDEKFSF